MKALEYTVSFATPAFLGNSQQQAQWRTPPFKALLRQWWRITAAKAHHYEHRSMRESEGDLFGNAWLTDAQGRPSYRKSRVSLRLDYWDRGNLASQAWPGGPMKSVATTANGKGSVRADLYLGFGPVRPQSKKERRTSITIVGAIGTDRTAVLRLFPDESEEVRKAIQLIAWFGTIGGRSRNGWGSLSFVSTNGSPHITPVPKGNDPMLQAVGREWSQCLDIDWPHALGMQEGRPLIWLSKPHDTWREAMGCLANVRVEVRRTAKSLVGPNYIGGIHLLGYPAGRKWEVQEFKKDHPYGGNKEGRLATQLRFKVCATPEGLVAVVFHLPHRFPDVLRDRLSREQQRWLEDHEQRVWEAVHKTLNGMSRIKPLGSNQ